MEMRWWRGWITGLGERGVRGGVDDGGGGGAGREGV